MQYLPKTILKWLLLLIIFTAPINLFYKLTTDNAYVRGFFIDYLVPKVYLHDIFILSFIIISGIYWLIKNTKLSADSQLSTPNSELRTNNPLHLVPQYVVYLILVGLSIIFIVRQFLTANPTASIYWLAKSIEVGLFSVLVIKLSKNFKIFSLKSIVLALGLTVFFQTSLAFCQFYFQKSLLPYSYLGETNLSQPVGLAKTTLLGREKVLAYGTTAHPNILAGTVVVYTLLALGLMRHLQINSKLNFVGSKKWDVGRKIFKLPTSNFKLTVNFQLITTVILIIASIITLALTLSFSAFLGLIFGVCGLLIGQYKPRWLKPIFGLSLALFIIMPVLIYLANRPWPGNLSLSRRNYLNQAAVRMWQSYPFSGVGLNNFTVYVEKFSRSDEVVRFPQPAHHVGLLFLAENGILGITLIVLVGYLINLKLNTPNLSTKTAQLSVDSQLQTPNSLPIISALLVIASLDHWLITQSVGLIIVSLTVIAFTLNPHEN